MRTLTWFDRLLGRDMFEVDCTVVVENTFDFLHSNVELHGVVPECGDAVQVIDPPTQVAYGETVCCERRAQVLRGGPWDAFWGRVSAAAEFPELFDLSFTERRKL
ncbi:hypothetical protein [uncultured Salinisphaera sp.]|uniref:hypothetical protein n=1 Tax=uncultured Salinisphaera sp. TaxID=359372 RepID=UPI0032B12196|tara:strand:+ start:16158 stop:16472 length:315 start_codon:yes stop_codon:yes gene_type:complete